MFDFKSWFLSLDDAEREGFALRAQTSVGYIKTHVIHRRKMPRRRTIEALALASNGAFGESDLITFLYARDAA